MIVLDRPTLRKLLKGELVAIPDPDFRYEKNQIYDIGTHTKSMMCRAYVVGVDRQTVQLRLVHQTKPTMLRRGPKAGYTDDIAMALSQEPEGFGPEELESMTRDARERWSHERAFERDRKEARSLANQLKEAQARAAAQGLDISPDLAAIRRRLDKVRRKLGTAA